MTIPISFNGYHISKILGCGSTSVVFLVEEEKTRIQYSAKVIPKIDMIQKNLMKFIEREIYIMKELDHPNIVHLYDTFTIQNQTNEEFIVMIMEYCENGDLLNYAIGPGFTSDSERKRIILEFLSAVQYLHNRGIAHGDIKAENILLGKDNTAKLCDFGYAHTTLTAGDESKNGTIYYAAPELFHHGKFETMKTDIWAIGITLYSILELQFPFKDGDQQFIIKQIVGHTLSIREGINKMFRLLIEHCCALDPNDRPTVDDIINDEYFYLNSLTEKDNNYTEKVKDNIFSIDNQNSLSNFCSSAMCSTDIDDMTNFATDLSYIY